MITVSVFIYSILDIVVEIFYFALQIMCKSIKNGSAVNNISPTDDLVQSDSYPCIPPSGGG